MEQQPKLITLTVLGEDSFQYTIKVNPANTRICDFYKAQLANLETYGRKPAWNYKQAGLVVGGKFVLADNETTLDRLNLTDYTPVLIAKNGMVEIHLSGMQSLY